MKKNKNVLLLGLVSFFNDMGSKMIVPILPMFIAMLGGGPVMIGIIGGIRDGISSLLQIIFGFLSDKTGKRKPFVALGYFSSAIFKVILAFSAFAYQILIFAGLERVGKGIRSAPRDAIIAESDGKQGKKFGIHRALDSSGSIIGTIIVILLFAIAGFSFKTIILIAGALAFISLIPLIWVKESPKEKEKITLKIGLKGLSGQLKIFLVIAGLFSLGNISYMFFIMKSAIGLEGKNAIIIPLLLYTLYSVFYAGLAIPFGILSDKIGRAKVLILGYLLFTLMMAALALTSGLTWMIILFAVYGIVLAMVNSNQRALISDLSPKHLKATALGTYYTITGLVAIPASIIAGILWTQTPMATFLYGGIASLLAVILFITAFRKF